MATPAVDNLSSATLQSQTTSDSSRTGSSGKSAENALAEKERDLTKDNAASPVDLECHIQEERITKILDEAIYKTKLVLTLPSLVSEYNMLSSVLSPQHLDDLIFIFEQYENPLFSPSLLNVSAIEDIKAGDMSLKNRLNPELGHLLYIMNSYPELTPKVEELVQEMKKEYLDDPDEKPNAPLQYLLAFENFRDQMVIKMKTTAADELHEKIQLKKLETSNKNLENKIEELTVKIKEENERFEKSMGVKVQTIARMEQELALLNQVAAVHLKKQVLDSDRQMVLATRAHVVKNAMLKEEEAETRENYAQLLKQHLVEEKNQRARRFKVETQLLSWLQKYDTEMMDKQVELDDLEEKLEEENTRCEELTKKLDEQDKKYIPLMEEREREYQEEMKKKMEKFQLEHAARVLQAAWREVLANRAEKKKLKKIIAKMKAEKEAAEKKAEKLAKEAAKKAKKEARAAKKKKH